MLINEIFYSLQGEGSLAGMPSLFIRLPGCPLRCRWCDTKYAQPDSAGKRYTLEQIKEIIEPLPTRHIVITGGEPMTNPAFSEFLKSLATPEMYITIETSGIKFTPDLPCDLMSISPKMTNSTPTDPPLAASHEEKRFDLDALQQLIDNYNYQLKFVIDTPADLNEIANCLEELKNVNPYKIFLMPQAATRDELIAKSEMLAQICKQTGFKLSQRLQVLLWNNQRAK